MKRPASERMFGIFNVVFLGLLGFLALYPFLYMISLSLSTPSGSYGGGLRLFPREATLQAYRMVLGNPEIVTGYLNTVLRTLFGTLLTVVMTSLTAYPLSRPTMPFRRALTFGVIFTMLFSGGIVPVYLLIKGIGLINNRLVYVLPLAINAFNILVVKSFFQGIPASYGEAARIDGANELGILWRIYVPMSRPVLATVALWTAVTHWNMWFDAMLYITDNRKQVMQTFLQRIVIEGSVEMAEKGLMATDQILLTGETIKAATVVVTILPMLVLYPFVQKHFIKGIQLGGIKA